MAPGNLSSHLSKLEEAGYIEIVKEFIERKPHTALKLTKKGQNAFKEYKKNTIKQQTRLFCYEYIYNHPIEME